jgi:hypothetical protein
VDFFATHRNLLGACVWGGQVGYLCCYDGEHVMSRAGRRQRASPEQRSTATSACAPSSTNTASAKPMHAPYPASVARSPTSASPLKRSPPPSDDTKNKSANSNDAPPPAPYKPQSPSAAVSQRRHCCHTRPPRRRRTIRARRCLDNSGRTCRPFGRRGRGPGGSNRGSRSFAAQRRS